MVGFTPVEEVEEISTVLRGGEEKEVRDFFKEEWVEEPIMIKFMGDLVVVVVVVLLNFLQVVEVEGTLVEAVELMEVTPVGEEEDLTTSVQINKVSAVLTQPAMVM